MCRCVALRFHDKALRHVTEMGDHKRVPANGTESEASVSQDSEGAEAALLAADPDLEQLTLLGPDRSLELGPEPELAELGNRRHHGAS